MWSMTALKQIPTDFLEKGVMKLLVDGELPLMAFRNCENRLVLTDRRIIIVEALDPVPKKINRYSIPYNRILKFTTFAEYSEDVKMDIHQTFVIYTSDREAMCFCFSDHVDLDGVWQLLSEKIS